MELKEAIKKRASIRKFSDKKPNIEDITRAIEYANLAPSPGNLSIIKYLIVEDEKKIEKISEICQQEFIKQSKMLLVICSEDKRPEIMYDKRAKKYIKQHAGAVIEHLLLYFTSIGLASCWVGAYTDDLLKDLLKIPPEIDIEAVLPIGYQHKVDKTKQRTKPILVERIFFDEYKNKWKKPFRSAVD
ncbi:MAG: nitroreductase family protein [Candidatus Pacearchaeota archaeon]|jgi:nitroreductase